MSAAEDLRTALLAHSALTDVIGSRVRQDMGAPDDTYPLVVFKQTGDTADRGLDNSLHGRAEDFQIESWGTTRAQSHQVHRLVEDALVAADMIPDPADPDAIDPDIGARACIWNLRIWTV